MLRREESGREAARLAAGFLIYYPKEELEIWINVLMEPIPSPAAKTPRLARAVIRLIMTPIKTRKNGKWPGL
jgi:hypothetical protein